MFGWLAVVVLALTSCDSENVTPINDNTLPEAIAKDFHERCEDYTIKCVYTAPEPYFDSGTMETHVTSEDNVGNECVVVYVDNAWNRTVRTLSEIDQLPSSVRYRLLTINQEARNDEFWEIKEVTQASINGTYYILCYMQDTPKLFSRRERGCGNRIVFEASAWDFASTSTKLNLLQMVDRGALTPNEWRRAFILAPVDGGDKPIRRLDTQPVDRNTKQKGDETT